MLICGAILGCDLHWRPWRPWLLGLALASALPVGAALAAAARITIVDGAAVVIDGDRRFTATEGQWLGERALIETGPAAVLLRIEWPDGSAADFGPATRAMVSPGPVSPALPAPGGPGPAAFYLLQGWAKHSAAAAPPAVGLQTPALRVTLTQGAVLAFEAAAEGLVFVESGSATATARSAAAASPVALAAGAVYLRAPAGWQAQGRATPAQLQRVPPGLRTTLPLRAGRFAGKTVAAGALPPPAYPELQPWLSAERALRADFPRRFGTLAADPAFRKGLVEHLTAHPEWGAVLNPERPRPPRPPRPALAASR